MRKAVFDKQYRLQCDKLFNMINHIGSSLNDRKNRFDKADLIEQAMEVFSNGRLKWADEIGYDLIDECNVKFEVKSQRYSLFTQTGKKKPNSTAKIKLVNTLQQSETKALNCTADYLIIIDSAAFSMAIIDYDRVVKSYSFEAKDGFVCQIPIDELVFLFEPSDFALSESTLKAPNYAEDKRRMQQKYISCWS